MCDWPFGLFMWRGFASTSPGREPDQCARSNNGAIKPCRFPLRQNPKTASWMFVSRFRSHACKLRFCVHSDGCKCLFRNKKVQLLHDSLKCHSDNHCVYHTLYSKYCGCVTLWMFHMREFLRILWPPKILCPVERCRKNDCVLLIGNRNLKEI